MIQQDVLILISIFCDADDFCKQFEAEWRKTLIENQSPNRKRTRTTELSLSEAMTIVVMFHKTGYRTFKDYYHRHRSPLNFLVNLVSGIVAYSYDAHKPTIRVTRRERRLFLDCIASRET